MTAWRLAKSLEAMRSQVNTAYPNRSKTSDGTIGDTAHSARKSDHNPNTAGVVQAVDITHDPAHGFDAGKFAEVLLQNRDPRIKYIISNARISTPDWKWKPYTGSNAHRQHVHISVVNDPAKYDDTRSWNIGEKSPATGNPAESGAQILQMTATNIELFQRDLNLLPTTKPLLKADGDFGAGTFTAAVHAIRSALKK